eukprot:gene5239-5900_t
MFTASAKIRKPRNADANEFQNSISPDQTRINFQVEQFISHLGKPMKRRMFTKLQSFLHNAVEALAPDLPPLETFQFHWKNVTSFFLETTDDRIAVSATSIPMHLEQMIEILEQEEHDNGPTGPCMEYMLQHKILDTMQTLGRADCPPGMKQQVLIFFTNLLGKMRQPLLPHVSVYKPVHKLIRCCGEIKAAPTENEEVQFLCQVCSKLMQDSYLVNFFLEVPVETPDVGLSENTSPVEEPENKEARPEYSLVDALLELNKSEDSRVAIKACEGLLLCCSIKEDQAATVMVLYTAFCERMADKLCKSFQSLPENMDPADVGAITAKWGLDIYSEDHSVVSFPGKRQLISFLSWLDYVNSLCKEAHPMIARGLGEAIRDRFLLAHLESKLLQASETGVLTTTSILNKCLKIIDSPILVQEFSQFVLGDFEGREVEGQEGGHRLRNMLIQRIDHLSDQISIETLKLFETLLNLPYEPILTNLILRNFKERAYFRQPIASNGEVTREESSEGENKPLLNGDDGNTGKSKKDGFLDKQKIEKMVNGYLMLLPDSLKTSSLAGDSGYDTYLRDAHKQCACRATQTLEFNWPKSPSINIDQQSEGLTFYEGSFLRSVFKRLKGLLDQPYDVNLILTALLSHLAQFPHPQLHEYLLDHTLPVIDDCNTLHRILKTVCKELGSRAERIPYFQQNLLNVRKRLMGMSSRTLNVSNEEMMESVIILEEFCKELAAIAFVKATS